MKAKHGFTAEEEALLREIYADDVRYWDWSRWIHLASRFGAAPIGLVWVLLPYRPEPLMPTRRRRMNELYLDAMRGQARLYGLDVRFDPGTQKLILGPPEEDEQEAAASPSEPG